MPKQITLLTVKIHEFFESHPGEWLTIQQIHEAVQSVGVQHRATSRQIKQLCDTGILEFEQTFPAWRFRLSGTTNDAQFVDRLQRSREAFGVAPAVATEADAVEVETAVAVLEEPETMTYRAPRQFTNGNHPESGIDIIDNTGVTLRCTSCRQVWSPLLGSGGRLPRGWWKCPNWCNE